jgi:hypothetical protein
LLGDTSLTPNGHLAVSASGGTLRVWGLESRECLCVFATIEPVSAVATSDRKPLAIAGTEVGDVLFVELRGLADEVHSA